MFYFILVSVIFLGIVLYYLLFLRNVDFFLINIINGFILHVGSNIKNLTALGSFYTTLFGGLFFVPTPIEVLFIATLKVGRVAPVLLIALYLIGMIISFTFNYFVGMKLSNISRKIIGSKKFYKIKGWVNKYGMGTVFLFNVLPMPSQPLAAILGVFRYNKNKFYLMFISGQLIKLTVITLAYLYIF
jgi:membrane protein YqaA with SNARE-associated domain